MPRAIDKDLLDCLERANPYTEYRIEISQPDTGQVLRRQDQYLNAPSLVSMAPALSLTASPRGALILTPATTALVSFPGVLSSYDLNGESVQRRVKGVAWTMDRSFSRVTLKSITAKIERVPLGPFFFDADIECQIFRITKTPGVKQANVGTAQYQSVAWTEYTFTPLLSPAPTLKASSQIWDGANRTTLSFDLTNWNLTLENTPAPAITPDQVGELPEFLIVVRLAKAPAGTGHFKWLVDNASARTIAGTGTFERVWWARDSDDQQWVRNAFADVPNVALNVDFYPVTGQGVFLIDQGAVPGAASTGRVDFQRSLPSGTSVTAEISTAGSGGPWTPVKHGDVIVTKQQQYHMRVTLNADAARTSTPQVTSLGVEFRIPRDVSVEGIPDLPSREIDLPWLKASIPEGKLRVVRTGSRDFLDVATQLGSTAASPQLEADIYLASRHPSITRDKWFRLERLRVTGRVPSATSEEFTLLSYASRLKRKIPQKVESINSVHVVQGGSPAAQLIVAPGLPGTTIAGNEYDGQGYYMRVRTTAAPNTRPGFVATIQGNTSTNRLDFAPALVEALVAGDVIEVHSGIYKTQPVTMVDVDPADAWDTILSLLAIPPERIGIGSLPRGGKPPRVADIAPGDATTQAKRKITIRLAEEEPGDELLDQISTILGGVTLEIDGQIVYVQIIPLVDLSGAVTIPLPPPSAVFDRRDIVSLQTPPGIEKRATIINCAYGTPATAADPNAFPSKSTTAVDGDALLWLQQQDLEDFGTADVPDKITRWLYNSSDAGLYLAAVFPTQLVKCLSTGLRVFPMRMTEKHPRLVPGDVVIVGTDQYTDYEPSTQTPIAGPIAIRGVIVRVGSEGRDLSIFVAGLIDNVQQIKGGNAGLLTGLGVIPQPPTLSASFDAAGQLIINSSGDFAVASQKIAWATGATPSAATVRAAAPIAQQLISGFATGVFYPAGTTVYIAAFAYNGNGVESTPMAAISKSREGAGVPDAPTAYVTALNTEVDDTVRNLRFSATAGSGGGGANLTYDIRLKTGFAAEVSLASGNALTLPLDLSIARDVQHDGAGVFIVTDTATTLVRRAFFAIPAQRGEVVRVGGVLKFKRIVSFDDNKFAVKASDSAGAQIDGSVSAPSLSQSGTWSSSGVTLVSTAATINDGDISNSFHTDTAVAGAYVQVDMGAATMFDHLRIYLATPGATAIWKVRHSPDGITFTDAVAGFNPIYAGWNVVAWGGVAKRYWRLELTNTPGGGPYNSEVEFANSQSTALVHNRPYPVLRYEEMAIRTDRAIAAGGNVKRGRALDDGSFATVALDSSGVILGSGVQQDLAGTPRAMAKGYQAGLVKDAGAVTFNPVYQNLPQILLRGGKAANATYPYDDFAPQSASASGFTCKARNKNKGTITARTAEFTAPLTATSAGATVGPATLASAPSYDTNYTARFGISVTLVGGPGQVTAIVAVESNDGVSGWIERATRPYVAGTSAGTYNYTGQQVPISDSTLGINDQIRLKLKSLTVTGPGGTSGSATLTGYDNTGGNGHGVTYSTSAGATDESKTPDADDYIFWESFEVVS